MISEEHILWAFIPWIFLLINIVAIFIKVKKFNGWLNFARICCILLMAFTFNRFGQYIARYADSLDVRVNYQWPISNITTLNLYLIKKGDLEGLKLLNQDVITEIKLIHDKWHLPVEEHSQLQKLVLKYQKNYPEAFIRPSL